MSFIARAQIRLVPYSVLSALESLQLALYILSVLAFALRWASLGDDPRVLMHFRQRVLENRRVTAGVFLLFPLHAISRRYLYEWRGPGVYLRRARPMRQQVSIGIRMDVW